MLGRQKKKSSLNGRPKKHIPKKKKMDGEQELILPHRVARPKVINSISSKKARLCACIFKETLNIRTDTPTYSKEGLQIDLVIFLQTLKKWDLSM